mgnify:CR=1 FL=1
MSEYDDFKNGDGFNEYIEFLKGNKEYMVRRFGAQ